MVRHQSQCKALKFNIRGPEDPGTSLQCPIILDNPVQPRVSENSIVRVPPRLKETDDSTAGTRERLLMHLDNLQNVEIEATRRIVELKARLQGTEFVTGGKGKANDYNDGYPKYS